MDAQIRYVRSSDGTTIAIATMGAGPPLVIARNINNWNGVERELRDSRRAIAYEELARHRTLVRFDPRGVGLSQREVEDISFAAHAADLATVVESLRVERVAMWGTGYSGAVTAHYAAQHPARVSRLVLTNSVLHGRERRVSEGRRVLAPIFEYDFDLWVRVVLLMDLGWEDGARVYAATGSSQTSKEMLTRQWRECRSWDVRAEVEAIRCPTLVIHQPTPDGFAVIDTARELAAAIPGARFRAATWDIETVAAQECEAVLKFLDEETGETSATSAPDSGTATILFADIVDSTALTERLGDAPFRDRARALDDAMRIIIRDNGGAAIDGFLSGDGVLATFPAASQAIDSALRCAAAGDEQSLPLHIGLHAGDVIREQNNVFGGAVNIASRISGLSAPGEVLVSDVVRALARTSASVTFEDRGEHALKGIADPVRVFAVRAQGVGT